MGYHFASIQVNEDQFNLLFSALTFLRSGKEKAICLYNEIGEFKTWGDYASAVNHVVDSLFEIDAFFTFSVKFNKDA
jgi:hypothetical protein